MGVAIALLEQLYRQSPTRADEITQLQQNAEFGEVALRDVLPVLLAVARRFGKCYVVLDALDECAQEHWSNLLYFLEFLSKSGCRLLVTSRPQSRLIFEDFAHIQVTPEERDIRFMVGECIRKSPHLPEFITEEAQHRISDRIITSCNGV